MGQDRASGAAGREYGLLMGRKLAELLGAEKLAKTSNEVIWNGRRAVIKACAPNNNTFGVTAKMLERLQIILVAFEDDAGGVEVWRLSPDTFRSAMRDSPSAAARGGDTKLVRKSFVLENGELVKKFDKSEIDAVS